MTNDQWLFLGIAGYCLALAFLIGAIASNVRRTHNVRNNKDN